MNYIISEEELGLLKETLDKDDLYILKGLKPIEEIASGEVINDRLYHRGAIAGYLELQELINERFDGKSIKIYIQEVNNV